MPASVPAQVEVLHLSPIYWVGFLAIIAILLALDLGVFTKQTRGLTARESAVRFCIWVGLAALFGVFVYFRFGAEKAYEFAAGYLLEESLSVDNIFVIILIFKAFKVPGKYQHRVLFWGIVGAVVLRALLIWGGVALIHRFSWMNFVFGGFLLFTGIKLFFERDDDEEEDVNDSFIVRTLKRIIPTSKHYDEQHFFTKERGKTIATPLFLVLLTVEFTDVVFALDSIPAIFGVTVDPFIIFTSNIFAILGLRTLYFLVNNMVDAFRFLQFGLAFILTFVGAKMCIHPWFHIPTTVSLLIIVSTLAVAMAASKLIPEKEA